MKNCKFYLILVAMFVGVFAFYSKEALQDLYIVLKGYAIYNSEDFHNGKLTLKVRILNRPIYERVPILTIDRILKEKYNVKYVNDDSYDLVIDGPDRTEFVRKTINNPKSVKFFYTEESVKPPISNYDLSIGFDYIEDPKYIRIPYAYVDHFRHIFHNIDIHYNRKKDQGLCNPNKPVFACIVTSNVKYGDGAILRTRLFHLLSLYKEVLSGGRGLNNIGKELQYYDAMEFMSQCKFVIAYENRDYDGYITEKVFQAYFSGAIPLYYGNKSVMHDINKNAIIYQGDFKSESDLVNYIKKVDQDDDLYCRIWNQNIIDRPEKSYREVYGKLRVKIFEVLDAKLKL